MIKFYEDNPEDKKLFFITYSKFYEREYLELIFACILKYIDIGW